MKFYYDKLLFDAYLALLTLQKMYKQSQRVT